MQSDLLSPSSFLPVLGLAESKAGPRATNQWGRQPPLPCLHSGDQHGRAAQTCSGEGGENILIPNEAQSWEMGGTKFSSQEGVLCLLSLIFGAWPS